MSNNADFDWETKTWKIIDRFFRDKTYYTTADKNVINKKVLIHKRRLEILYWNPNFWMPALGKS